MCCVISDQSFTLQIDITDGPCTLDTSTIDLQKILGFLPGNVEMNDVNMQ